MDFLKQNRSYFAVLFFTWVSAFFLMYQIDKGDMIIFFSDNRAEWKNNFFKVVTQLSEAGIYILAFCVLLFVRFRYVAGLLMVIVLAMLGSFMLKYMFAQPRPYVYFTQIINQPDLVNFVPEVHLNSSRTTSFPSGHTISAFAIYGFLAFITPSRQFKMLCLAFAIGVGVSRMYLVQHFLEDVVAGAFVGTCIAVLVYLIQERFKETAWGNRALVFERKKRLIKVF